MYHICNLICRVDEKDVSTVLERFSKGAGILADLIHLQEQPSKVGPETALECVRRAIWGMLYADDACIVSRSTRGWGG